MQYSVEITKNIHWLGVNDRRKHLFENLWPLPNGVSYNSYLIVDDKSVLMDTVELGADSNFLERVEVLLGGRKLDYLVINHMEPDHSGELENIVSRYPDIKIIGNSKTFQILKGYWDGLEENLMEIKDGDVLEIGQHRLKFVLTPWVHWPETMMTYEETEQVLFSGDAFGTFGTLDGGVLDRDVEFAYYEDEMRRYYSNIVGKYGGMVQKALAKLADVPVKTICSLHGPVWQENAERVVALYDKWSRCEADDAVVVIYGSMYGNTAHMADYIAGEVSRCGVKDVRVYDVSKTHVSYLISEIWRCRGVMLGSCAYNSGMFPLMQHLCDEMLRYGLKKRLLGLFGTGSWIGGGVRTLKAFAEESGWEQVAEAAEIIGRPESGKYAVCDPLAQAMAERIVKR